MYGVMKRGTNSKHHSAYTCSPTESKDLGSRGKIPFQNYTQGYGGLVMGTCEFEFHKMLKHASHSSNVQK
jgi:hypothetical protein